jgi:hypothetical protein
MQTLTRAKIVTHMALFKYRAIIQISEFSSMYCDGRLTAVVKKKEAQFQVFKTHLIAHQLDSGISEKALAALPCGIAVGTHFKWFCHVVCP